MDEMIDVINFLITGGYVPMARKNKFHPIFIEQSPDFFRVVHPEPSPCIMIGFIPFTPRDCAVVG
jgi:hypothetical protein